MKQKKQLVRLTESDLHRIIKESVNNILKESQWDDITAKINERLAKGEDPNYIFDYVYDFHQGFALVKLNDEYNFLTTRGRLLTNQWYDIMDECFYGGFARVYIHRKGYNFINKEGQIISNQWFDEAYEFKSGFAKVELNKKLNYLNADGQIISNQWFDDVYDFKNDISRVYIEGKGWNFLNTNGQLLFNQWYKNLGNFYGGFADVYINGEWKKIDRNGEVY